MKRKLLSLFVYWISERHNIFLKKENKEPWPWTADPIFQEYKFTNPFRQNDRVTRELLKVYGKGDCEELIFKKIIIFRMFNWPLTYDILNFRGLIYKWNTPKAITVLKDYKKKGNKVFTGAYIISNKGERKPKVDSICEAIAKIVKSRKKIIKELKHKNTLRDGVEILSRYSFVGQFIGYELVTDLRHTKILCNAKDIYTWANPGPGAKRGIHRILYGLERGTLPSEVRSSNIDYQSEMLGLLSYINMNKKLLIIRKNNTFEMRDVEHSLCEFDKYCRVKFGEGRPRSKYHYTGEL